MTLEAMQASHRQQAALLEATIASLREELAAAAAKRAAEADADKKAMQASVLCRAE